MGGIHQEALSKMQFKMPIQKCTTDRNAATRAGRFNDIKSEYNRARIYVDGCEKLKVNVQKERIQFNIGSNVQFNGVYKFNSTAFRMFNSMANETFNSTACQTSNSSYSTAFQTFNSTAFQKLIQRHIKRSIQRRLKLSIQRF